MGNRQSLVNNQVNSIIEDSDGDLWFGTSNGISLYDSKQKQWRSFLSSFNQERLELVVKIGSMALIQKEENAIDYNIFQRLGGDLRPGMLLVTSGATEIGRLDYLQRTGPELTGVTEQDKVDYSAQGQPILLNTYRRCV